MQRLIAAAIAVSATLAPQAVTAQKLSKNDREAIASSPEEIARGALITDDPFSKSLQVSTQAFYAHKSGLFQNTYSDKFFRAFINKKTGATVFQLYVWVTYDGDWQFFDQLNYIGPNGPESVKVTQINRIVNGCSRYTGCRHTEHVAAELPEEILREAAVGAQANTGAIWPFKLYGRTSQGVTAQVLKTEIAGLMLAVDFQRRRLGFE